MYISRKGDLPVLIKFSDFQSKIRLSSKLIYWLAYENNDERYVTYYISKSSGKKREINEPCLALKIIQKWILVNILEKLNVTQYSYGFKKGDCNPMKECASRHKNNLYLMKLDIKNFYNSISKKKVRKIFSSIYNSEIAYLLTNLCVHKDCLPQGAPTSAYLANLVSISLDNRIAGYCNKHKITYTRYADDMFFSCNNRQALREIYPMINKIIKSEGYSLNLSKTNFKSVSSKRSVLGITINDGNLKCSKELKRNIRSIIYNSIMQGDYSLNEKVRGYIAYVDSVEDGYKTKCTKYIEGLLKSDKISRKNKKLYYQFPIV